MNFYEQDKKDNIKEERFNISPEQEIYIDAKVSNINIYGIYEDTARIRYSDRFTIDYGNNATRISESIPKSTSNRIINMNGSNIICSGSSNIIISNNNVTIVNGQVINSIDLDIFLPKAFKTYNFVIRSESGNVIVSDLSMAKLDIKCENGNIKLYDIDILCSSLINENGNIKVEVNESRSNYDARVYSENGKAKIKNQEEVEGSSLLEKRTLIATSENGNVKVLFKGKR